MNTADRPRRRTRARRNAGHTALSCTRQVVHAHNLTLRAPSPRDAPCADRRRPASTTGACSADRHLRRTASVRLVGDLSGHRSRRPGRPGCLGPLRRPVRGIRGQPRLVRRSAGGELQRDLAVSELGIATVVLAPRRWPAVRWSGAVYTACAFLVFLVLSPIGTNVERLAGVCAPTVLLAALLDRGRTTRPRRTKAVALVVALVCAVGWIAPGRRARTVRPPCCPPHVNLARGWNRQLDMERGRLFYDGAFSAERYRTCLDHWAVGLVVPAGTPSSARSWPSARAERRPRSSATCLCAWPPCPKGRPGRCWTTSPRASCSSVPAEPPW